MEIISGLLSSNTKRTEETEISVFFIFLGKNVFVLAKNMSIKMYVYKKVRAKDKIIVKDISKAKNLCAKVLQKIYCTIVLDTQRKDFIT